ncbi:MAG: hypothetical protein IH820_00670 [Bacteroidetes bacterium]|nr:hypothetical protein [Bacteroidota bacterium]
MLTNYKMLDYLLIRPRDAALWKENTPESLRYLVVDELHTFDGAQGTDLACLVLRLTDRLQMPSGHLCCVGTSATLGDDRETDTLCAYASKVFNTPFTRDAVVTEARKTSDAFLRDSLISRFDIVPPAQASALDPQAYEDDSAYLHRQAALWFGLDIPPEAFDEMPWRVDLGRRLKEHSLFRNLLTILGGRIKSYDEILERLAQATDVLQGTPRPYQVDLLNSFVALIATARRVIQTTNADGTLQAVYLPLVNVRCQLCSRSSTFPCYAAIRRRPSPRRTAWCWRRPSPTNTSAMRIRWARP